MLQTYIQVIISFIAGGLVGAWLYYQYVNHIWRNYPEQFRFLLESRIGKRHACSHITDGDIEDYEVCGNPAPNQCQQCQMWFCDLHYNQSWFVCLADKEKQPIQLVRKETNAANNQ